MANLFSEFTLCGRTVKNRIVFPAMVIFDAGTPDGKVDENYLAFYEARGQQDLGIIITAATCVSPSGRLHETQLGIWNDDHIEGLARITPICHRHGSLSLIQIHHAGARSIQNPLGYALAPSVATSDAPMPARAMTLPEIQTVQQQFVDAALRAEKAGFDGVEIHGAHSYLISQFFSSVSNKREDSYGGSPKNRARFATEIIARIREATHPDFIIACRVGCNDPHLEDSIVICQELERAGCDLLDVSFGFFTSAHIYTDQAPKVPDNFPYTFITYGASQIKKHVSIPVVTVYGIRTPEQANDIIEQGWADMVAVLRGLLVDKDWTVKGRRGEDVVLCAECKPRCHYFVASDRCPRNRPASS